MNFKEIKKSIKNGFKSIVKSIVIKVLETYIRWQLTENKMTQSSAYEGFASYQEDRPVSDIDDAGVSEALSSITEPVGTHRFGARKVHSAEIGETFVFTDGTKCTEAWRAFLQVDSIPYDITFGPLTTREGAIEVALSVTKNLGGQLAPTVKGPSTIN